MGLFENTRLPKRHPIKTSPHQHATPGTSQRFLAQDRSRSQHHFLVVISRQRLTVIRSSCHERRDEPYDAQHIG